MALDPLALTLPSLLTLAGPFACPGPLLTNPSLALPHRWLWPSVDLALAGSASLALALG